MSPSCSASHTKSLLSFDDIPEVPGYPVIGALPDYAPWTTFRLGHIHKLWHKRHEEFGDIFKERIFSTYTVYFRSPADTEKLFRTECKTPTRLRIPGITKLKNWMDLPESVVNMEGRDWYRMRQEINYALLKPKMVWKFTALQQDVCKDLVTCIRRHHDATGEVPNFCSILDAWALEMAGVFLLNTRFGLLTEEEIENDFSDLFHGTKTVMDYITSTIFGLGLWDIRSHKNVSKAALRCLAVTKNIITRKSDAGELNGTTLGNIMESAVLAEKEKISLVFDVLCGSIETTAKAVAMVLYCTTLNGEVQEKLRAEVLSLNSSPLDGKDVDGMPYTGAFLKEVQRLYPMAHCHVRTMQQDTSLSGYHVPAGTMIINTANATQNKESTYFPEPDEFMPERWLTADKHISRFALTGPFGMGARACPGRRFAVQEMKLLLIETLKNFRIEYHHRPMESLFRATGIPSEKPRFSFIPLR